MILMHTPTKTIMPHITRRESEVLQALADGGTNADIALRLKISPHTVKFHVNALLSKFDAWNRAHMIAKAFRSGLVR